MRFALRPRVLILFVGDIFFFIFSLWLSLALRELSPPSQTLFLTHLLPFSFLFVVWAIVFFIAGLYEARSVLLARRALSSTLLITQTVNMVIAAMFFFFIPFFGIEPKTLLFIYLAISFLLILAWRALLFPRLGLVAAEHAIAVGESRELNELIGALNGARFAPARVSLCINTMEPGGATSLAAQVTQAIETHRARFIIADWSEPTVAATFPLLYNLLSRGVRFLDALALYEEAFGRMPTSAVDERWLASTVSRAMHMLYDPLKRMMDIALAVVGGAISLIFYPFIILAIKLEGDGPVFVRLDRVGKEGRVFSLLKFRSMTGNDNAAYGTSGQSKLHVTRIGGFLRKSRLDELPQFWNLLRGDLSFVGPRPESPALVALYQKEIPYYSARHLIKPGLAGWAQLYHDNHPHHGADVEATREKLSYDLYYLRHRSLMLDLVIALKTIKKLLARSGA
jgi:lipopolysaccharide/colanic/teichoic acid biosynthesis glycosyltransferase